MFNIVFNYHVRMLALLLLLHLHSRMLDLSSLLLVHHAHHILLLLHSLINSNSFTKNIEMIKNY